jgi:hypothetical protein
MKEMFARLQRLENKTPGKILEDSEILSFES